MMCLYTVSAALARLPNFYLENKSFMRLRIALASLLACSSAALAQEPVQLWLDLGVLSYHFKEGDYREENYGLGLGVFVSPEHGFVAGSFINSNNERSHYGAYHWRPWHWNPAGLGVRAGLMFGLIDGYSNTNNGNWFPVVLPTLSAEYGHFGANLIVSPHPKNGTALALQLRVRLW
jgi:hypothetical protein